MKIADFKNFHPQKNDWFSILHLKPIFNQVLIRLKNFNLIIPFKSEHFKILNDLQIRWLNFRIKLIKLI